jgi:hypothetical protein
LNIFAKGELKREQLKIAVTQNKNTKKLMKRSFGKRGMD